MQTTTKDAETTCLPVPITGQRSLPTKGASMKPPPINTFTAMLTALEKGEVALDLDKAMRECVAAVNQAFADEGGTPAAVISLKVGIRMGKGGVMEVYATHDTKLPKRAPGATLMWATPDNNLALNDPAQMHMFDNMKVIDGGATRVAGVAPGEQH